MRYQEYSPERIYPDGHTKTPAAAQLSGGTAPAGDGTGTAGDRTLPLEDLWGRPGREIEEQVVEVGATSARVAVMEVFLYRRPRGRTPRVVEAAVKRILESGGRFRVGDLAGQYGISERQLSKAFRAAVGISPKTLARLMRFQQALRLAGRLPWAELAAECGYND